MPKIAEIEDTPNPNAVKFILREPLTWGITRSYDNAEQAQDGEADWPELVRKVAEPIRAAPAADSQTAATVAAATTAIAGLSPEDQLRLRC